MAAAAHPDPLAPASGCRAYFDLQLAFADRLAALRNRSVAAIALHHTNLHRRFGLGAPPSGPQLSEEWRRLASELDRLGTHRDRVDWTLSVLARSRPQPATPPHRRFGCFTLVPPDAGGVVRLHFANHEDRDMSPLAPSRLGARRGELAALFRHLQAVHPDARLVRGASWLYNIVAYRSLFPERYIASGQVLEPAGLSGSSSWGQFLDHRGALKDEAAADFRATFERLDPDAPWRLFPLRPLRNEAPIEDFYGAAPP